MGKANKKYEVELLVYSGYRLVGVVVTLREDESDLTWHFVDMQTFNKWVNDGYVLHFTSTPVMERDDTRGLIATPSEIEIEKAGVTLDFLMAIYSSLPIIDASNIAKMLGDSNKAVAFFEQRFDMILGIILLHGTARTAVRASIEENGGNGQSLVLCVTTAGSRIFEVDGLRTGFVTVGADSWKDVESALETLEGLGVEIIVDHIYADIHNNQLARTIMHEL
jgi:hypothetical protein